MVRRFPEFAQLPSDIRLIILEYICDRRDPIFELWPELRLVCREWSEWFSIGAIHRLFGYINRTLPNDQMERMTSIKFLYICVRCGEVIETETLKRLASMIPPSVRHLRTQSVKLLFYLPRNTAAALQTIKIDCGAWEPQIFQSLKSAFRKFGGRIKSVQINPNFRNDPWETGEWENIFDDCALEELTITKLLYQQPEILPLMPATMKRLNITHSGQIELDLLSPAAGNLEIINARSSDLVISSNAPVFPKLKELLVKKIVCSPQIEYFLKFYFPNLEKIKLDFPSGPFAHSALFNLPSLRSIYINDNYVQRQNDGEWGHFDFSCLPPLVESFEYASNNNVKISGQPRQVMKHLRKLDICVNTVCLPKGVFNFFPALEEFELRHNSFGEFEGIDLVELLPLRDMLVDLTLKVSTNDASQDVLCQFSRLKRLQLSSRREAAFRLDRLPQSLEKLNLDGYFIEGNQMEPLLCLKKLHCWKCSVPLVLGILRNAPNLREIYMSGLEDKTLLNGLEGMTFERVSRLKVGVITELLAETVFQLLRIFPNIRDLRIDYRQAKPNNEADKDFPAELLSFLNNHPSLGKLLVYVKINSRKFVFDKSQETSKAALQELQNKGIQLEVCAW